MQNAGAKIHLNFSENPTLTRLVEDLVACEFALKNSFRAQSLEQIKDIILNHTENLKDAPYLKAKEAFILVLQELEICGLEIIPVEPLSALFGWQEKVVQEEIAGNDFYKVYSYFKQTPGLPFSEEIRTKLLGQQLSLALEGLGQKALHPHLSAWWPTRESAITLLINPEKQGLELHPDLSTALNRLALLHQELLTEPIFPQKAVENSLRYLLSISNEEDFTPAPLEVGYLLFFFGQQEFLERFLHNSLNITGVEADEIVDFSFRMIRTQRLKTKAFSQKAAFTKLDLELMEEDYEALNRILVKLNKTELNNLNEAA